MPVRMCMACRKRRNKNELIRAVAAEDKSRIIFDKTQKAQRRGFYICPECLTEIQKRRVFERVLGHSVSSDAYKLFADEVNAGE